MGPPSIDESLPWVAYASALGYQYAGGEYCQTFEDRPKTSRARRAFVQALAARVHLDELHPGVRRHNPRIVQQVLYMFMSESAADCGHQAPSSCRGCPRALALNCSVDPGARAAAGGTS